MGSLDVTGGPRSLGTSYDAARTLADHYDDASDHLRRLVRQAAGVLLSPAVLSTALLSPRSFARAEGLLAAAASATVDASVAWEADARAVRAAAAWLEDADEAAAGHLAWLHRRVSLAAEAASWLWPDPGPPTATQVQAPTPSQAPSSWADLMADLAAVAALSGGPGSAGHGTIAVQTTHVDGTDHHVVHLPGTDTFSPPWASGGEVRDLLGALETMGGDPSAYTVGVEQALADAGVEPGEPVLLVGHSQGGMAAWWLAHHSDLTITHVVTAGSPLGAQAPPTGVEVVAFENAGDVVPASDLVPNQSHPGLTTVGVHHPGGDPVTSHGMAAYVAGAADADGSAHPALAAALGSLQEAGFLAGGPATTQVWQVTQGVSITGPGGGGASWRPG